MLSLALDMAANAINTVFEGASPATVAGYSLGVTMFLKGTLEAYKLYQHWDTKKVKEELFNRSVKTLVRLPVIGPMVQHEIERELGKVFTDITNEVAEQWKDYKIEYELPDEGMSAEQILKEFATLQKNYHEGKISGAVYAKRDEKLQNLLSQVWKLTELTNPLHSEWPLIQKMKAEIISWCQNLLHGQSGAHGVITHGGTTSIIEACFAYVMYARSQGKTDLEIIVPETAHVAFDKAAEILNVKLIKVPVDKQTGKADAVAMEKAITTNTCMIAASAPSFPFGIVDPIEQLGPIAKKHNIPFHVDVCLGSTLIASADKAGFSIPPFDFRVLGVTSASFDTHKFGEGPKGTSILLFSPDSPASPTQSYLDWVGGLYVTDNMDGSRSGADIATLWATMRYLGKDHYVNETKKILTLRAELVDRLKEIDGIEVAYDPQLSVVGIKTKPGINSLLVVQKLKEKNWSLNVLQTPDQQPDGFHFCLTSVHANWPNFLDEFTKDLNEAVNYVKEHPQEKPKGLAKAYGILPNIPKFLHDRIGDGFAKIQNAVPGKPIPGIWELIQKAKEPSAFAGITKAANYLYSLWKKPATQAAPTLAPTAPTMKRH